MTKETDGGGFAPATGLISTESPELGGAPGHVERDGVKEFRRRDKTVNGLRAS
jgi:hypothetical protein